MVCVPVGSHFFYSFWFPLLLKVKGVVGRGIGRITCWFKCRLTGKSLSKRRKGAVNNVLVIKKIRAVVVGVRTGTFQGDAWFEGREKIAKEGQEGHLKSKRGSFFFFSGPKEGRLGQKRISSQKRVVSPNSFKRG